MGRPKGSKSKNRDGYVKRTENIRKRYGEDAYKKWGKMGGNPILLKKDSQSRDSPIKTSVSVVT